MTAPTPKPQRAGLVALRWLMEILEATDPNNPDSHYCDHPRECAEAIAFDVRRGDVLADARAALSTLGGEGRHG